MKPEPGDVPERTVEVKGFRIDLIIALCALVVSSLATAAAVWQSHVVAQQLSLTLGAVQTFTEQSDDYLGYCGVGFLPGAASPGVSGSASTPAAAGVTNGRLTPIPPKPKKHKAKRRAHKAQSSENTCQLEADVTIVYSAS